MGESYESSGINKGLYTDISVVSHLKHNFTARIWTVKNSLIDKCIYKSYQIFELKVVSSCGQTSTDDVTNTQLHRNYIHLQGSCQVTHFWWYIYQFFTCTSVVSVMYWSYILIIRRLLINYPGATWLKVVFLHTKLQECWDRSVSPCSHKRFQQDNIHILSLWCLWSQLAMEQSLFYEINHLHKAHHCCSSYIDVHKLP